MFEHFIDFSAIWIKIPKIAKHSADHRIALGEREMGAKKKYRTSKTVHEYIEFALCSAVSQIHMQI